MREKSRDAALEGAGETRPPMRSIKTMMNVVYEGTDEFRPRNATTKKRLVYVQGLVGVVGVRCVPTGMFTCVCHWPRNACQWPGSEWLMLHQVAVYRRYQLMLGRINVLSPTVVEVYCDGTVGRYATLSSPLLSRSGVRPPAPTGGWLSTRTHLQARHIEDLGTVVLLAPDANSLKVQRVRRTHKSLT